MATPVDNPYKVFKTTDFTDSQSAPPPALHLPLPIDLTEEFDFPSAASALREHAKKNGSAVSKEDASVQTTALALLKISYQIREKSAS